jgi:hypothetical protein
LLKSNRQLLNVPKELSAKMRFILNRKNVTDGFAKPVRLCGLAYEESS